MSLCAEELGTVGDAITGVTQSHCCSSLCQAVWAGWGHASENHKLPELLQKNGIAFLGKVSLLLCAGCWAGGCTHSHCQGHCTGNAPLVPLVCPAHGVAVLRLVSWGIPRNPAVFWGFPCNVQADALFTEEHGVGADLVGFPA